MSKERISKIVNRAIFLPVALHWLILLAAGISTGTALAATNMTPVAVTGFNRDLVVEASASGPPYTASAAELDPGEGTAFYQSGLSGQSYGLPASGTFTSALGDGTVFQFQPYTSSNALVLSSETSLTSGALTLSSPQTFSRIAILANSTVAPLTGVGALTLQFTDHSTFVTNYNAPDWFSNSGFALEGVDRINLGSGAADGGANGNPRFYQTTIDLAAALGAGNKPLASLTFSQVSPATATAIYAVSGLPAPPTNPPSSVVAVLTQHNDNGRTGMNLNETSLNVTNVNTNQFGLLFSRNVDDQIYAQPLVMTNVNIPGQGVHNLVLVATVNDSVYAFDADNPSAVAPYWSDSFIHPPNVVPPVNADLSAIGACEGGYEDFSGNIGIVGTPVIDPVAGTIYLVARTKENGVSFVQRLHALDVSTGAERSNSPVIITATCTGTGTGSVSGVITFDPERENQRPGLALVNGTVYISWASHCDLQPYHGWIMGYNQTTLQQVAVYNATPNGSEGGIWMSGQAPAADENGNLYLGVGNGSVDTTGGADRGESFLKLVPSGTNLTVASWFTPYDWQYLENNDLDLGSGGLLLIPGTTLAFSGGKEGMAYLFNRDAMGGLTGSTTTNDNVVQSFPVTGNQVHGGAVWWDGPGASYGYLWPATVYLQQYVFNRSAGQFVLPAFAQSPTAAPSGQPGGILALSANGTNAGTGIIWAVHQLGGSANQQVRPGILHAYNAQNVGVELWNSEQLSWRDTVGSFAKFVPPTIANGKVYLATFANRLNVYGLQPPPPVNLVQSGMSSLITWPTNTPASYTLQSTTNLVIGTWVDVTNSVTVSNAVYEVTVPQNGAAQFYRLKL